MSLILILVGTSSYYTYMYVMWTTKYVYTVLVYRSFENGRNKSRGKSRPTFTSRVMYSHVLVVDLTYDKYRILNRIHMHDI